MMNKASPFPIAISSSLPPFFSSIRFHSIPSHSIPFRICSQWLQLFRADRFSLCAQFLVRCALNEKWHSVHCICAVYFFTFLVRLQIIAIRAIFNYQAMLDEHQSEQRSEKKYCSIVCLGKCE